jgi:hypothetical protein
LRRRRALSSLPLRQADLKARSSAELAN